MSGRGASPVRLQLGSKNAILLGAAVFSLAVGYVLLSRGDVTMAPILLVLGYCVLFPLGVAA